MMRWMIHDEVMHRAPAAIQWCEQFVARYDVSELDWVRIDLGRSAQSGRLHGGAYGRCHYPQGRGKARKGFRLSCQVPGPFPFTMNRWGRPLYRNEDGTWPPGYDPSAMHCLDHATGRQWIRRTRSIELKTMAEAIVYVFAHECYHWLRKTRQIPGVNREVEADDFAVANLNEFRAAAAATTRLA
jgi:hypothetical protein